MEFLAELLRHVVTPLFFPIHFIKGYIFLHVKVLNDSIFTHLNQNGYQSSRMSSMALFENYINFV